MRTLPAQLIYSVGQWSAHRPHSSTPNERHTPSVHWWTGQNHLWSDSLKKQISPAVIIIYRFHSNWRHHSNERIKSSYIPNRFVSVVMRTVLYVAHADGISFILFSNFSLRSVGHMSDGRRLASSMFRLHKFIWDRGRFFVRLCFVVLRALRARARARASCPSAKPIKIELSLSDVIGLIYLHFGFRCEQVYFPFALRSKSFTHFSMHISRFNAFRSSTANVFISFLPVKYLDSSAAPSVDDYY